MSLLLISVTSINFMIGAWLYVKLRKSRLLFNDRFGFTASYFSSSIVGLVATINLTLLFPAHIEIVGVLNILLGMSLGYLYGSLLNEQTLITGIYNGGISAIMGTMLGAVVKEPTICGLPENVVTEQEMIIFFTIFSLCLQGIAAFMLLFSFKA